MLVKLSVLLGFLVAVSLGQPPDCSPGNFPRMDYQRTMCCANIVKIVQGHVKKDCFIPYKAGVDRLQTQCDEFICIMKKNNLLLPNNKIDRAAITKFVKQNLTDYAPNIETLLEKCVTDTEISKCSPLAFLICAENVLMKECPSASWEKSEECTFLKNIYNICPNAIMFPNFVDE